MKVGRVETIYPPECRAALQPILDLIEQAKDDARGITGIDDPHLTATALIDYRAQAQKMEAIRMRIREYQQQAAKIMSCYLPQITVWPEPPAEG